MMTKTFKLIGSQKIVAACLLLVAFTCQGQKEKNSVYFGFNEYALGKTAKKKIDSLLRDKNIQGISLQGHCDSIGDHGYNDALSSKRVLEVKKYMVSKKVPGNLIEIKALGKRVALNKNRNEHERSLNRRVEIELTLKRPETLKPPDAGGKTPVRPDEQEVIISGVVLDEERKPIIAEISLNDDNGDEIQSVRSSTDGKYRMKATLKKKEDYSLVYYHDSSFVSSRRINLSNPRLQYQNLKTVLPQLRGGKKYVLENFHFVGDTSQLVAYSLPSLEALYKLMKKNRSLVIRIEGHVNYPKHWGDPMRSRPHSSKYFPPEITNNEQFCQWLSDERANMVYDYLAEKGIAPERLSRIGYGAHRMLFPDAESESEQEQNRRVEINVVSFK